MTTEAKFREMMVEYVLQHGAIRAIDITEVKKYIIKTHKFDDEDLRVLPSIGRKSYQQKINNIVSHHALRSPDIIEFKFKEPIVTNMNVPTGKTKPARWFYMIDTPTCMNRLRRVAEITVTS